MRRPRRTTSLLVVGLAAVLATGACTSSGPEAGPAPTTPSDCPDGSSATISFVDFVRVGERTYTGSRSPSAPTTARLGRTILTTRCEYAEGAPEGGYEERSGDAAYLPVGTAVRELVGFDPAFRIAAEVDGQVRIYQADPPPARGTAAEVFPGLGPHVTAVHLTSPRDARTVLARIADPARVRRLVSLLLASPYAPRAGFGTTDAFLSLRLDDGTTVSSAYGLDKGQLRLGIQTPPEFRDALRRAVTTSEGQATPRCTGLPGDFSGLTEAEEFIGMSEVAARALARQRGLDVRVVGRDGRCTPGQRPNSSTRVNVDVRGGVVRDAARY